MDMPVFVKVEDFKDALALLGTIRSKLEDAKRTLEKVHELKTEEDTELELWNTTIDEVEKKLDMINKSLSDQDSV